MPINGQKRTINVHTLFDRAETKLKKTFSIKNGQGKRWKVGKNIRNPG